MKNLFIRTITGTIYVAILIVGLLSGVYIFAGLFAIIAALCLWEFYGLVNLNKQVSVNRIINVCGGVYLFLATFFLISIHLTVKVFLPYISFILFVFILELYRKKENPLMNLAYSFLGQMYIALPIALLNWIVFYPDGHGGVEYTPLILVALFVFIWANDTGAYLIGVSFGKHRLFERISPKKSWEGFFGGLILALSCSLILSYLCPQISLVRWVGLGAFVVILATFGDLTESLMKRTIGVKDSGKALPGHGGFLDRFDSMLFAIYVLAFYMEIFVVAR
ncbi:MAG: phosphatidate cytidylyltransferase [Candidatus Azobacteroides sp.]|nr:phosphatidate cytidylyltransferase [Candidatus Azobacteroides sp.]